MNKILELHSNYIVNVIQHYYILINIKRSWIYDFIKYIMTSI